MAEKRTATKAEALRKFIDSKVFDTPEDGARERLRVAIREGMSGPDVAFALHCISLFRIETNEGETATTQAEPEHYVASLASAVVALERVIDAVSAEIAEAVKDNARRASRRTA